MGPAKQSDGGPGAGTELLAAAIDPAAVRCPLCGCGTWDEIDSRSGAQLHAAWEVLGIHLPWECFGDISPTTRVVLHRCASCQCEFFDPKLAGGGDFYQALEHPEYYSPNRPEFDRTCEFASSKGLRRVLDVGCGDGSFLNRVRRAGMETHGLELNKAAADRAKTQGHTIHHKLLHEVDHSEAGGYFDLITLFQVLEHVTNPVSLMKDARRLLAPNGWISVSVPSAEGILRVCPSDPHQWPPHHVTRWRRADLASLGSASDLLLDQAGGDPLFASDVELFLRLQNRVAKGAGMKTSALTPPVIRACSQLFKFTGLKRFFPESGVSLYGYYRRA